MQPVAIYTRHNSGAWEYMLRFPDGAHAAMLWLVTTYQPDADFWLKCEFKILND